MIIRCPQCEHARTVNPGKIPASAELATCPKCSHRFRFRPIDQANERATEQAAAPAQPATAPSIAEIRATAPADIWEAVDSLHQTWERNMSEQVTTVETPVPQKFAPRAPASASTTALRSSTGNKSPLPSSESWTPAAPPSKAPPYASTKIFHSDTVLSVPAAAFAAAQQPHRPSWEVEPLVKSPTIGASARAVISPLSQTTRTPAHPLPVTQAPIQASPQPVTQSPVQASPQLVTQTPLLLLTAQASAQAEKTPSAAAPPPPPAATPEHTEHEASTQPPSAQPTPANADESLPSGFTRVEADAPPPEAPEQENLSPEMRVENAMRMLRDDRADSPVRDLGKIDEYTQDDQQSIVAVLLPIPWEDSAQYGKLNAFMATVKGVMFDTAVFFQRITPGNSLTHGYLFFLLQGYIAIICTTVWGQAARNFLQADNTQTRLGLPVLLLVAPLALGIIQVVMVGIIKLMLQLAAPEKAEFSIVFKIVSYAAAPLVLCIIPFVGPVAGVAWFLIALIAGCRHGLGLNWPMSIGFSVPPALLCAGGMIYLFL